MFAIFMMAVAISCLASRDAAVIIIVILDKTMPTSILTVVTPCAPQKRTATPGTMIISGYEMVAIELVSVHLYLIVSLMKSCAI